MTPDELRRFLSRITYKPGYRLNLEIDGITFLIRLVLVTAPLRDVQGGADITLRYSQTYDPNLFLDEYMARRIVGEFLLGWEIHERDEWFKLDGKQVRNPH